MLDRAHDWWQTHVVEPIFGVPVPPEESLRVIQKNIARLVCKLDDDLYGLSCDQSDNEKVLVRAANSNQQGLLREAAERSVQMSKKRRHLLNYSGKLSAMETHVNMVQIENGLISSVVDLNAVISGIPELSDESLVIHTAFQFAASKDLRSTLLEKINDVLELSDEEEAGQEADEEQVRKIMAAQMERVHSEEEDKLRATSVPFTQLGTKLPPQEGDNTRVACNSNDDDEIERRLNRL